MACPSGVAGARGVVAAWPRHWSRVCSAPGARAAGVGHCEPPASRGVGGRGARPSGQWDAAGHPPGLGGACAGTDRALDASPRRGAVQAGPQGVFRAATGDWPGGEGRPDGVYAQAVDHPERDGATPNTLATSGGSDRVIDKMALDNQDSCSAPLPLPAAPDTWRCSRRRSQKLSGVERPWGPLGEGVGPLPPRTMPTTCGHCRSWDGWHGVYTRERSSRFTTLACSPSL
jgi:hypothetical protein